jgi:hypothetical protein
MKIEYPTEKHTLKKLKNMELILVPYENYTLLTLLIEKAFGEVLRIGFDNKEIDADPYVYPPTEGVFSSFKEVLENLKQSK